MGRFLIVVVLFAAVVYAGFWLLERRRGAGSGRTPSAGHPSGRRSPGPRPRPAAPDDDEDFLRGLNPRDGGPPRG